MKLAEMHVDFVRTFPIYALCYGSGHNPITPPIGRFLPQTEPHLISPARYPQPGFFYALDMEIHGGPKAPLAILPKLAITTSEDTQAQCVQFDEALGVFLVIRAMVILEGHNILAIERVR